MESLDLLGVRADAGVQATQATAAGSAGETPLLLSHEFGKGRALLMNLTITAVQGRSAKGAPETPARLMQWVLGQTQVAAPLTVTGIDGQRLRNVEITRWMNGSAQIVSVFRHHGTAETAELRLPIPLYVYDIKARKYLGKQQTVTLEITPFRAQFYVLAPQPPRPVVLNWTPSLAVGNVQRVTMTSSLAEGQQAVKVQVKLPDGSIADWVCPTVVTDKRGVVVDVPVAHNDPKGRWTVSATDVYTGATSTARFTVKSSEGGSR